MLLRHLPSCSKERIEAKNTDVSHLQSQTFGSGSHNFQESVCKSVPITGNRPLSGEWACSTGVFHLLYQWNNTPKQSHCFLWEALATVAGDHHSTYTQGDFLLGENLQSNMLSETNPPQGAAEIKAEAYMNYKLRQEFIPTYSFSHLPHDFLRD